MANKTTQTLSAQILPLGLSESDVEKAKAVFNTPEMVALRRESRQLLTNAMLKQVHDTVCSISLPPPKTCSSVKESQGQAPEPRPSQHSGLLSNAFVEVQRQENVVTINWKLKESVANPQQVHVTGSAWEIDLIPDTKSDLTGGLIVSANGSGSVRLELEEGIAYQFEFQFVDLTERNEEDVEPMVDVVFFQVAIPLSNERKALLRKAVTLNFEPEEAIRHEVNSFLGKRTALEDALKNGIAQIKAKRLSAEDEEEQIQDLSDHVKFLINKYKA